MSRSRTSTCILHRRRRRPSALRADVRPGLTAHPEVAAAEVVLRRARQRAVRGDHPAARVLPDPGRARDPRARAGEIAARTGAHTLVELGSGSSEKTRLLLDALRAHGTLRHVRAAGRVASGAARGRSSAIAADYPGAARCTASSATSPSTSAALPGGGPPRWWRSSAARSATCCPAERADVPRRGRATCWSPASGCCSAPTWSRTRRRWSRAYDDAAGVTAEFNRNVLRVLNRELGADFDLDGLRPRALWDAEHEWIEMRLRAPRRDAASRVAGPRPDGRASREGEEIRTEISAKFRREGVEAELATAGFALGAWWTDDQGRFALSLAPRGLNHPLPHRTRNALPAATCDKPPGHAEEPHPRRGGWGSSVNVCPAASYSPTPFPVQYHRR